MSKELLEQTRKENLFDKYLQLKVSKGYDPLANIENNQCTDCIACKGCTACIDCQFCTGCKRCISSVHCENSSNLIYCAGLINHYRGYWILNQEVTRQEFKAVQKLLTSTSTSTNIEMEVTNDII